MAPSTASRRRPAATIAVALLLGGCATAALVDRGDHLAKDQQWDQAVAAYEEALAKRPADTTLQGKLDSARRAGAAHYALAGRKAEETGDLNAALADYDRALSLHPAHEAARTDRSKVARVLKVTGRKVARAQARLQRGDCLGAKADFEGLLGFKVTFPEVEKGRVDALTACFDKAMAVARVFADLGDDARAEAFAAEADGFYPGHPDVATLRARLGGTRAASERIAAGHVALQEKRWADAAKAYREGLAKDGGRDDARKALGAAVAYGVAERVRNAARDQKAGRTADVLAALEGALALDPTDEKLKARLVEASKDLRKRSAAGLFQRGQRADEAGLFGAAWVWYRLADLVGKPFLDAEMKARVAVARIDQVVPYRVLVVPPDHETVHGGLGGEIARELLAALAKDLEATRVTLTLDPGIQPPPDGILRGRLTRFEVPVPSVEQGVREVPWEPPAGLSTNPALGEALGRYARAAAGGDAAEKEAALAALRDTPTTLRSAGEPIVVPIPTLAAKRTGTAGAELELYDRGNDRVVTAAFSDVEYAIEDQGALAFEPLELPEDPIELPDTPAIRRRLVIDLVADLQGQLGPALRLAGLRFQRLAERVSGDARLHYVVLALVAGTPDAEALKEELLTATGYRFGDDTYDPDRLPR